MRSMLDDAWDAALAAVVGEAEPDLRVQLRSGETEIRKAIASGSLASISANGRSQTWSANGAKAEDVAESWRDLVDLYDKIKAELASNDDAEIKAEMMARLVPATEWQPDFSGVCR